MSAQTAFMLFVAFVVLAFLVTRLQPAPHGEDLAISAEVIQALSREFSPANVQIDVKTFDGVVILGGFVREHDQMLKAVDTAKAVKGVKSVDNRLSVRSGG